MLQLLPLVCRVRFQYPVLSIKAKLGSFLTRSLPGTKHCVLGILAVGSLGCFPVRAGEGSFLRSPRLLMLCLRGTTGNTYRVISC